MERIYVVNGDTLCTDKMSGIPRYAYEVLKAMDHALNEETTDIQIQVVFPKIKQIWLPDLNNIKVVPIVVGDKKFASNVLRKYIRHVRGISCHLGNGICYNKKGIVCIHDVRAIQFNDYDSMNKKIEMNMLKWSVKLTNSMVVTVSNYQKIQISKLFGIARNRIFVIPNGWEHINEVSTDINIFTKHPEIKKGNYYYALGSMAKHKNYKWVHEVAKRNPSKQFVVAGNISKEIWGVDGSEYILENVIILGYVTDEENKALLENCRMFLHPSKYEGFGIPPLEALALNKKIAISRDTCLPEIYGDCAAYFDSDDYDVNLEQLEKEPRANSDYVLDKYTWENAGKKWIEILKYRDGLN